MPMKAIRIIEDEHRSITAVTEALRQELAVEQSPIGVTCVHPGGIRTNIARSARYTERAGWIDAGTPAEHERLFATPPERAAKTIVRAILQDRPRTLIGRDAVAIDLVQRLLPTLYQRVLVAILRRKRRRMLGD